MWYLKQKSHGGEIYIISVNINYWSNISILNIDIGKIVHNGVCLILNIPGMLKVKLKDEQR